MTIALSIILSLYGLLMLCFLIGWILIRRQAMPRRSDKDPGITIIVAVRNEAENILSLIDELSILAYPPDKLEVLLVNDHSTDDTMEKINGHFQKSPYIRVLVLPDGMEGKKEAITFGITSARFEIIVTTDADCRFSKNWIRCISTYFESDETKLLTGAVKLVSDGSFFGRLQVTEFISLAGTTASAIGLGHPVMCNGANLAFRKQAFIDVGGYEGNLHIASGDDEFLLRKIFRHYPSGIRFLNYYEAVVSSQPQDTLRSFFEQRFRWAGKWKYNSDPYAKLLAIIMVMAQLSFSVLLLMNIWMPWFGIEFIIIKIFLEGVFIFWVGRFLDRRFDIPAFMTLQVVYPFYITLTGVFSLFIRYSWKGRNYNN